MVCSYHLSHIMSSKIVTQFCAICEREKTPVKNSSHTPLLDLNSSVDKGNTLTRHKYGHLPSKKNEDFFTQVTEPQWLRRGNLKESDSVCKRHLAILMRGVDRGCEGGCSSPLHRGARLCKPGTLKTIPPTWRKKFMHHPKIKDEDKEVMMICWDCYKKHIDRMSKYGDPMGRTLKNKAGIQRSHSLADTDESGQSIMQAMKRYKSMDKLDSGLSSLSTNRNILRRASTSSTSPRSNGSFQRGEHSSPEARYSPSKRLTRGRRSHKSRRSPSPPNNISPVRTSFVHSKRKHSPHKYNKPPSAWRTEISTSQVTPNSSAPRLSVDEGNLADTESPRDPPVPPPGLFSHKIERSDDVFDVFCGRRSRSEDSRGSPSKGSPDSTIVSKTGVQGEPKNEILVQNGADAEACPQEFFDREIVTETVVMQELQAPNLAEESITSADEMAAIFANQNLDGDFPNEGMDDNNNKKYAVCSTQTIEIPEFSDISDPQTDDVFDHKHESSSGSDKTGDTQIELDDLKLLGEDDKEESFEVCDQASIVVEDSSKISEKSPVLLDHFKESVFISPALIEDTDKAISTPKSTVSYHFYPQSFRRLESARLQYTESTDDGVADGRENYLNDSARDKSHPLRNYILFKIPRDCRYKQEYIKMPGEDVEIFPDVLSFLDGVTQTVGDEMTMYAQSGVQIVNVDMKKTANKLAHNTSQFADDSLIVRRGQSFEIDIELSDVYQHDKHKVMVELILGDSPKVSNGTHILLPVQPNGTSISSYGCQPGGQWSAYFTESSDKLLKLSVASPFTCAVGTYQLYFQVENEGTRSRWQCGSEDDRSFVMLFNPWNIDDAVFMSSQSDRMEYVVSDTGCVYAGNQAHLIPIPWIFGQNEPGVLRACIELLESSIESVTQRGDPVTVTKALNRKLSKACARRGNVTANSISNVTNLQRYLSTGDLQVDNDNKSQSTLLVTVCRCLGLPSRVVTCLNCAKNTDIPLTVNAHYSTEGQSLDYMNTDKIWPCYTWTDVWMSRVDLPPGFGGWQVLSLPTISPTNEYYGPVPAYGIKKGQTSCCERAREHFIALNSDKKHWIVAQDGTMDLMKTESAITGSAMVTKSAGSWELQDISKLYKFSEGCEEHKLAVHTAIMHCGSVNGQSESNNEEDIHISLSTNPNVVEFGNDVDVVTKISNKSETVQHLTVNLDGAILGEDGSPETKLSRETILAEVLANESVEIPVKFNVAPYLHKLSSNRQLCFTAFGSLREQEGRHVIANHLVGIKYPEVEIQLHGEFEVGGEVTVLSRLRNPLPNVLRNASVDLCFNGMTPIDVTPKSRKSVGPWQVFKCERLFRCQRSGRHTVVARFSSDHLNGPCGMQEIEIT